MEKNKSAVCKNNEGKLLISGKETNKRWHTGANYLNMSKIKVDADDGETGIDESQ